MIPKVRLEVSKKYFLFQRSNTEHDQHQIKPDVPQ